MTTNRQRGVSLVELLAAGLILAVGLVGIFSLWTAVTIQIRNARLETVAGNIARADIESARVQGWAYLPRPATGSVTWLYTTAGGESIRTAQWSATRRYTDTNGTPVANSVPGGFAVDRQITDIGAIQASGSSPYRLQQTARRMIRTRVTYLANNLELTTVSTQLARGGL